MSNEGERAVVVTTEYRGVFFGYATDVSGETIKLRAARNCIYWSAKARGFMGLAATGPDKQSRVGAVLFAFAPSFIFFSNAGE